ncbi:MAG: D-glycerate dehydrogenase [Acidobacteriota bacterium]
MIRPRIFLTRALPPTVLERLSELCDYDLPDPDKPFTREALIDGVREAHGLISLLTDRVDREVINAAKRLRIIANVAVGYNNIDIAAASERDIVVTNTPDVLTDATADLTWALILAVTRRIVEADTYARHGNFKGWDFDLLLGSGLTGKKLGIIGYGRIGRAVARRASGFGMTVIYCGRDEIAFRDDPRRAVVQQQPSVTSTLSASARLDGLSARRVGFHQLIGQADIVTIHVPVGAVTRHLINQSALEAMKPSTFVINTARGEIIDETALVVALEKKQIAGAGLDVFEREPEIHPTLKQMSNVVLLPHIGSATLETRTAMAMLAAENVIDLFSGHTPRTAI